MVCLAGMDSRAEALCGVAELALEMAVKPIQEHRGRNG